MLNLLWISSMAKTLLNFIPRREGSLRRRSPSCHHRHRQAKRERRGGGFAYASKMLSPLSSVRPSPPNGEPTQKGKTQNSNSKKKLGLSRKKIQRHFTNHNIIVQWQKRGGANQDLENNKSRCQSEVCQRNYITIVRRSFLLCEKIRERETSGKNTNIVHHNWAIIK